MRGVTIEIMRLYNMMFLALDRTLNHAYKTFEKLLHKRLKRCYNVRVLIALT